MDSSNKRVTLKDIAQVCGYSANTVSRALRDDSGLPANTVARIRETAQAMGYMPNVLASSLRSGETNLVALIIEDFQNPHYTDIIARISTSLRSSGYQVLILCSPLNPDYVKEGLSLARSYNVSGIILFPQNTSKEEVRMITMNRIPLVLVDREVEGCSIDAVRCDDYQGGYLAGQFLLQHGHRRFLFLEGTTDNPSHHLRLAGFRNALAEENVPMDQVRMISHEDMRLAAYNNDLETLLSPVDYTAIIGFNDLRSYAILDALTRMNYRVPEDISIISYDHIRAIHSYLPPLTSIATAPADDVAGIAVSMLLQRMEDETAPPSSRVLPVMVYDEGTVGIARSAGSRSHT